jgi:hypothetical protein
VYRDRTVTDQPPSPPNSSQLHQLWWDITVETTKGMLRWIFRPQGRVSHNVLRPSYLCYLLVFTFIVHLFASRAATLPFFFCNFIENRIFSLSRTRFFLQH